MIVEDHVYLFTDATVNIEPTAEDLCEIACLAADFAKRLEIDPRVAFLSFSNFGSTPHPLSDKVRRAVELTKSRRPTFHVDGEMQADTAVVADIIENRYPFSAVKDANVLVFPSLESANIAYKLLARLGKAKAIGPILLGMGAPVHVLQTGDDVNAIVQIASVAVMDAMGREERSKLNSKKMRTQLRPHFVLSEEHSLPGFYAEKNGNDNDRRNHTPMTTIWSVEPITDLSLACGVGVTCMIKSLPCYICPCLGRCRVGDCSAEQGENQTQDDCDERWHQTFHAFL